MATNWEIGNDLMHNVVDNLFDLSNEFEKGDPYKEIFINFALAIGVYANDLVANRSRMCPEDQNLVSVRVTQPTKD